MSVSVRVCTVLCVDWGPCRWQLFVAAVWSVPSPLPGIRVRATLRLPPHNFLPISREAGRRTQAGRARCSQAAGDQPGRGLSQAPRGSAGLGAGPAAQGRWCWHPPRPLCAQERAARRPRELTRPRVSAGIPAPALNMPVIFISLRQAAKAIPPVAAAAATQCFPLVGRGNGGRPDFLITWC